jgi:hypothetical protein
VPGEESPAARICRRLEALKGLRSDHEQTWRECYDYTHPIRGSGLQSNDLTAQTAKERKAKILDSTGTDAARTLASGVVTGSTPSNALWFKMEDRNATQEENAWFDESSESLWQNIHASTYDANAYELALDIVDAGWGVLYVDEDRKKGGFTFEVWPMAQCFLATTKPGGLVDTVFREFDLTVEQAVETYGLENLSPETQKLFTDQKFDERVQFVHAIEPRSTYAVGAKFAKNLPVASCHVEVRAKKLARESGYHEMPCVVPRWALIPKSAYAVGPAFDALPDMKELNAIKALELANLDIAVSGMWIAEDDGVLMPRTIQLGPRKVIVANSVESMKALETGADFSVTFTKEADLRAAIRRTFMADQLEPQDGPVKTATEIHVRVELIRQLLGPLYGRLQAEWLRPFLARCFGLAMRASQLMWAMGKEGVFNPPPESLNGREFSIKFTSPIARAQSLEEVSAMDRHEAAIGAQATVKPEVLDTYDFDEAARTRAKLLGVPAKLVLSDKQVQVKRQARADAQADAADEQTQRNVVEQAAPKVIEKAA